MWQLDVRFIFSLCLVLWFSMVIGQPQISDSLLVIRYKDRVNYLYNQGQNFDSLMIYLDEVEAISLKNGFNESYIFSLLARYNLVSQLGYFSLSECYIDECMLMIKSGLPPDHIYQFVAMNSMSNHLIELGNDREAIHLVESALKKIKSLKKNYEIFLNELVFLQNLGTYSNDVGDSRKAIHYYEQVIRLAKDSIFKYPSITQYLCSAKYGLGALYYQRKDYKKSIKSYKENLILLAENYINPHFERIRTYISLADVYQTIGEPDSGMMSLRNAWEAEIDYEKKSKKNQASQLL